MKKIIYKRLNKNCSICGKEIKIILYNDDTYRNGHYFGKIPIYSKKELNKIMKSGSSKKTIAGFTMNVLNYEGKPYRQGEYWECPKCYWSK